MRTYFLAEKLKYRHTPLRALAFLMPLLSVILAAWLTRSYFAATSYNWWYTGLYPGFLGILCGIIGGKDKRKKNVTIWTLPCSMAKLWDAKILVGAAMSGMTMACMAVLTIVMETVMENGIQITFIVRPAIRMQLAAGIILWLTTLWQIPFCLLLSQKMGMALMLFLHLGSHTLISAVISLRPWFALFPGAIASRLMCPVLGILPNGLPAVEGQMTYAAKLMETGNLLIGIPASLLWFLVFWRGSRKYFQRQVGVR